MRITKKEIILKEKYNGINPLCQCGCGTKTDYKNHLKDFSKYYKAHHTRAKGHWGDLNDINRVNAIKKTRKAKFASGEYNHILKAIQDRDGFELGKKISKATLGIARPKPVGFGIGRIQSKKTREKMSQSHLDNWENGNISARKQYTSKLEKTFENILELLEIDYQRFFFAKEIRAYYDFYLPKYNIIIEVDGDFWHCNPNTIHNEPKYDSQKKNIERDKVKNEWASQNNYKLLRFWENDINNNIKQVKQILLENIKV